MRKVVVVVSLMVVLGGCSVIERLQSPGGNRMSSAMRVMQAAGQADGLSDLMIPKAKMDNRDEVVAAAQAALKEELAPANAVRTEPVVYPVQAAFMSFRGRTEPLLPLRTDIRFISWMPASMAADEAAARLSWSELLEQAAVRVLPDGHHAEAFEWINTSADGVETTHRVLRVDGPLCPDGSCVLEGGFISRENPSLSPETAMRRVPTPGIAGHGEAQSYTQTQASHVTFSQVTSQYLEVGRGAQWHMEKQPVPGFDHDAFYRRLSAELPEWTYVYAGPENAVYSTSIPVMLHRGQELFFTVPARRVW